MKRMRPRPLHDQARAQGLSDHDRRELQLFRQFLREPGPRWLAYERVYSKQPEEKQQEPFSDGE